jgi:hypothetical protein
MARLALGIAAIGVGLALLWFSLMLAGLGMFCFDGSLLGPVSDPVSLAPDCFIVNVNSWANPRIWLLGNLFGSALFGIWAHATGYGLLRNRPWASRFSLAGTFLGIVYFIEIAAALPQFQTLGIVAVAGLGVLAVVQLVAQKRLITA